MRFARLRELVERLRPGAAAPVRVVTDSTACIDAARAEALGVVVVPLTVISGDLELTEGVPGSAEAIAAGLGDGVRMTTSQPSPAAFGAVYEGAPAIVSVHLSREISGTCASASTAGRDAAVPVVVVDAATCGAALGDAVLAAAECAAAGADAEHVAARAREVARRSTTLILVDSLEHLRRGGRLSATSAALGAALGVRPILHFVDGKVVLLQRVRTRRLALARVIYLVEAAASGCERPVVTVQHVGAGERAALAAAMLTERLGVAVGVVAASSVVAVHVGPGAMAVSVSDLGNHSH